MSPRRFSMGPCVAKYYNTITLFTIKNYYKMDKKHKYIYIKLKLRHRNYKKNLRRDLKISNEFELRSQEN
jgi:hypothetical protein